MFTDYDHVILLTRMKESTLPRGEGRKRIAYYNAAIQWYRNRIKQQEKNNAQS